MLLIVSIKIMILHTDRLLPTCRVFKLLPLTGGGKFVIGKNYLGETTTLGCEHDTFGARGITQLRMMSAAGVYRRKVSRAGFSERPDG
jgi:hypothetical protein